MSLTLKDIDTAEIETSDVKGLSDALSIKFVLYPPSLDGKYQEINNVALSRTINNIVYGHLYKSKKGILYDENKLSDDLHSNSFVPPLVIYKNKKDEAIKKIKNCFSKTASLRHIDVAD